MKSVSSHPPKLLLPRKANMTLRSRALKENIQFVKPSFEKGITYSTRYSGPSTTKNTGRHISNRSIQLTHKVMPSIVLS